MKSLKQRTSVGAFALLTVGVFACVDTEDELIIDDDIVLTGNGGSAGVGGAQNTGGSGFIPNNGGTGGIIVANGGTENGNGGTENGNGGTENGNGGTENGNGGTENGNGGTENGNGGTENGNGGTENGNGGTENEPDGGTGGTESGNGGTENGNGGTENGNGGTENAPDGGTGGPDPLNLITNPDFESGTDDWSAAFGGTLSASTAEAHGGAQSAVVTGRTGTFQGAHYDITDIIEMGATYSASAFAMIGGADSDTVKLSARIQCEGQGDQFITLHSTSGNDADWTELSGDLVIPQEFECFLVNALLYVEGPAAGVDLYVDDVDLRLTEEAIPVENLIENSDFEIDASSWSAAFGGTLSATTEQAHSGAQSALVTDRNGGTYQGAHYDLTDIVDLGATYSFSAFAMVGAGATSDDLNLTARLRCFGQADQYITIDSVSSDAFEWNLLSGDLELPSTFECSLRDLLVYVEGPAAGVDLYVDDVWAYESVAAPVLENLVLNSDFETGVAPWTAAFGGNIAVSTDQARNGEQSAVVTGRTATSEGAFYDMTDVVEPGGVYEFSAFTRISAASDTVNLTARLKCDGQADQFVPLDTITANNTDWSLVTGELEIPAEFQCFLTEALVYVEGPAAGVDIFVDDVRALEVEAPEVVQNLFTNSDFEAGTAGWTAAFGGTMSASTAQAHSGAQSVVVTGRTGTFQGAFVNMTSLVDHGATYRFSMFARISAATGSLNLTARRKCEATADAYTQIATTAAATNSGWVLLTGNYTMPALGQCNLTELLVYVEGAAAGVDIFVDDAWAVETAAPVQTNLLVNSTFESGFAPWTAAFGGTMGVSAAQAHSGAQSGAVTGRTGSFQGAFYNLTSLVQPGNSYALSTFARVSSASETLRLTARRTCSGVETYTTVESVAGVTNTAWSHLNGTYALPADCVLSELLMYVENAAAGVDIFVDDAFAVQL